MMARLHVNIIGIWGIADQPSLSISGCCRLPVAGDHQLLPIVTRLSVSIASHCRSPVAGDHPLLPIAADARIFTPPTSRPLDYSPQLGGFALKSRRPSDNSPSGQLAHMTTRFHPWTLRPLVTHIISLC